MQINELINEDIKVPGSIQMVLKTSQGIWYSVTLAQVKKWYKLWYGHDFNDVRADATAEYFMFVEKGQSPWGFEAYLVSLKDQKIRSVNSSDFGLFSGKSLQEFVKLFNVQSGELLWGTMIVYKGDAHWSWDVFNVMPPVATVAGKPVHEVPKDDWWILNRLKYKYQVSSDRVLVFFYEPLGSNVCVSIKKGKITSVTSLAKITKDQVTKISSELSAQLNLNKAETGAHYLMPKSKAHRMLQVIKDNPSVGRADLYWKHLKLKQLPSYRSASDLVSQLVSWQLVEESSGVRYEITPKGIMVLAALNADKKVPLSGLVKE